MSDFVKQRRRQQRKRRRSLLVLFLLILLWCISLGWGIALAIDSPISNQWSVVKVGKRQEARNQRSTPNSRLKNVDPVSSRNQLGQELYLENCSSCHLPVPPAVLPTETWRQLLERPQQHYDAQLPLIISPSLLLMWDYLRTFSRPLNQDEPVPNRVESSRYFRALHPRVDLPQPITLNTCASCHPNARQFNYRSLTPKWENSP